MSNNQNRPLIFSLFVGLRISRARRRSQFVSFISVVTTVGIALGVATLVAVMSVMNGFQTELKNRILENSGHGNVYSFAGPISDWQEFALKLANDERVAGVAPFIDSEIMVAYGSKSVGGGLRGIDLEAESHVTSILEHVIPSSVNHSLTKNYTVVLGRALAEKLGVKIGEKITIVTPEMRLTPAGLVPRMKRFEVIGLIDIGLHSVDSRLVITSLESADKLLRMNKAVTGLRIKTFDPDLAPITIRQLVKTETGRYWVLDWTQRNRNLFSAIAMQKTVMFVIFSLVVGVAAFNLISSMMMLVREKRGDIAILRTLGCQPGQIMQIFVIQGAIIGSFGLISGYVLGILLALNIGRIADSIEAAFSINLLPKDVYLIDYLPAKINSADLTLIGITATVLILLATLYPSWRAAKSPPAEALRHE